MNIDQITTAIITNAPLFIAKVFIVSMLSIHFLFSLLLIRQTRMMLQVVEAQISPLILLISVIHAFYSLIVLLIAVLLFHF